MAFAPTGHNTTIVSRPPRMRALDSLALLIFFTAAYALVGRGTIVSIDEEDNLKTTFALVQRHTLAIEKAQNAHPGTDGRLYASRGILPSILCGPCCVMGLSLSASDQVGPPPVAPTGDKYTGTNWPCFLTVTLLGPLLTAFTLLLLYHILLAEGVARRAALALVFLAGWATPLAVYAKTIFPQVFETAWLMLALTSALRWRQTRKPAAALWLGIACGLGLMTRAVFAFVTACFLGYLLLAGTASWRERLRAIVRLCIPAALGASVTAWANWLRWGSPFDFGHHHPEEVFDTPPLKGLYGLLVSPGKGIFLYAPVLVLVFLYARTLWQRGRAQVLSVLAITLVYLGLYCRWYDWQGGRAWGPRFLVPLIPLWIGLLGQALVPPAPRGVYGLLVATAAIGLPIQVLGLSVHLVHIEDWFHCAFSLEEAQLLQFVRVFFRLGPDDYWLQYPPGFASPVFTVLVLLLMGLLVGSGWLLWRRQTASG